MPHWFALAMPDLPLQLVQRRFDAALEPALAIAVIEGPAQRTRVAFSNPRAQSQGVIPGIKLAAAQALAHDLIASARDAAREQAAMHELSCWAYQFSPSIVAFRRSHGWGLMMETGASERLFGGRLALHRRIAAELRQLGYHAASASAATPAAARLLAAARAAGGGADKTAAHGTTAEGAGCDRDGVEDLAHVVGDLPLHLLGWDEGVNRRLQALGLSSIAQILALPRDAFARRFGAASLIDLDRLLGRIADPQPPFTPPSRFAARMELPADTEDALRLQAPLQRLLLLLEGYLRGHNAGATALQLRVLHSARRAHVIGPTLVPLALAAPERDPQRLLQLYAERLSRVRLQAPAILLELQLERMALLVPESASFLPPASPAAEAGKDILHLAETLHARLGSEGVFQLQAVSDHRPERAYRITPLSPEPPRTAPLPPAPAQRPMLILPQPQRLAQSADARMPSYQGMLSIIAGPERIEAGWWDLGQPAQATVHRDYFVARNPRGQTVWVYREMAAPHHWFLHGFFA
jgi:protein ImuB